MGVWELVRGIEVIGNMDLPNNFFTPLLRECDVDD